MGFDVRKIIESAIGLQAFEEVEVGFRGENLSLRTSCEGEEDGVDADIGADIQEVIPSFTRVRIVFSISVL